MRNTLRDGASSAATSRRSSESIEALSTTSSALNGNSKGFSYGDQISPSRFMNGLPRRQYSAGSRDGSTTNRAGNSQDQFGSSNSSSFSGKGTGTMGQPQNRWQDRAAQGSQVHFQAGVENNSKGAHMTPLTRSNGSSNGFLEAAEVTIQELRKEAMMWERNARKSVLEVETLKQQITEQAMLHTELEMEFSATQAERNSFKQEVEQLKSALRVYMERERGSDNARFEAEDAKRIAKEFQEEIQLQKEANVNLNLQLGKTQEANMELVFALQELEETIEQQNVEIEKLSEAREKIHNVDSLQEELEDMRCYAEAGVKVSAVVAERDCLKQEVEQLKLALEASISRESITNAAKSEADVECTIKELKEQINEQKELNKKLSLKLQKAQVKNRQLLSNVQDLDEKLAADQRRGTEHLSDANEMFEDSALDEREAKKTMSDIEAEWMKNLLVKEEEIRILKAKICGLESHQSLTEVTEYKDESQDNVHESSEMLRREMNELERDCKELTDENIELIYKLNKLNKDLESKNAYIVKVEKKLKVLSFSSTSTSDAHMNITGSDAKVEIDGPKSLITQLEQKLKSSENSYSAELASLEMSLSDSQNKVMEVQNHNTGLKSKLNAFMERIRELECELQRCHGETVKKERELAAAYEHQLDANEAREIKAKHELTDALQRAQIFESENIKDAMEIDGLKSQVSELKKTLESSETLHCAQLVDMEKLLSGLQDQVMELRNQNSGLKSNVSTFKDRIRDLESEVQTAQQEKVEREIELAVAYENRLQANEARAVKAEDKLADSLQIVQTCEADKAKDAIEIDGLKCRVVELEQKLKSLEDLYSAEFAGMERSLGNFKNHVMELQNENLDMETKLNALKKRNYELESELQTAQEEAVKRETELAAAYEHRLEANEARAIKAEDELEDTLQKVKAFECDKTKGMIEIDGLRTQVIQLEQKLKSSENSHSMELAGMEKSLTEYQSQVLELLNQNSGLETKVTIFKEKIHELENEVQTSQQEALERENELAAAYEHQLEANEARVKKAEDEHADALQRVQIFESDNTKNEMAEIISEQQKRIKNVEDQAARKQDELSDALKTMINLEAENERMKVGLSNECIRRQDAENLITSLHQLNEQLKTRIEEIEAKHLKTCSVVSELEENASQLQEQLYNYSLIENNLQGNIKQLEGSKMKLQSEIENFQEEGHAHKACIQDLEFQLSVLTEEVQSLRRSNQNLDMGASKLQMEKTELEDKLEAVQDESKAARERLGELGNHLENLTGIMESNTSAMKCLEKRAIELEHIKEEIENHLTETKEKNVRLSEQICRLESQLSCVTEERDSYKSGLENSEACGVSIQAEMHKLELEHRKECGKLLQTLHELENKLSGALEEVDSCNTEKQQLQLNSENLKREHALLLESKSELEQQSFNLFESRANQEECLQKLTRDLSSSAEQVKSLELELSDLRRDINDRERIWVADTEAYHVARKEYEEKAVRADEALRQAWSEKSSAVESLQKEVDNLTRQMSSIVDQKERVESEALLEASKLREEKVKMEDSLFIYMKSSGWETRAKDFEEKEKDLCAKIGMLESINQQLMQAQLDSDSDPLQMEVVYLIPFPASSVA
eukprot:Gb_04458 [translate_table: standard]